MGLEIDVGYPSLKHDIGLKKTYCLSKSYPSVAQSGDNPTQFVILFKALLLDLMNVGNRYRLTFSYTQSIRHEGSRDCILAT